MFDALIVVLAIVTLVNGIQIGREWQRVKRDRAEILKKIQQLEKDDGNGEL